MTELRDALERLAERGTPVGPRTVYDRATRKATPETEAAPADPAAPSRPSRRKWAIPAFAAAACLLVLLGALVLLASDDDGGDREVVVGPPGGARSTSDTPSRGGTVVYGLENEERGGWCLPEAQLSRSGIEVASAIYETLTVPARAQDGTIRYAPYLAESVEHNAAHTEWSIRLRPGIKFHNGEALTAAAVKLNLDAYRGRLPSRTPLLFRFILNDVTDVQVVDPLTVRVVTRVPWVAFDAFLWSDGRLGIAAPRQLQSSTCDRRPVGTGPFRFVRWKVNDSLVVQRNSSYWRRDSQGRRLPYLDRIDFRPIPDPARRVRALEDGDVDLIDSSDPQQITRLRQDERNGAISLTESNLGGQVNHLLLNSSQPPFNDRTARLALAHALDFDEVIGDTQAGVVRRAVQPFTKENIAYVAPDQLDYPGYDPDQARTLVRRYERDSGQALRFQLLITGDEASEDVARLVRDQAKAVGIDVTVSRSDTAAVTNTLIGGSYQAALWRNHGGGDPDLQSVWWENGGTNPLNFGRINDPEINRLLQAGRSETDPDRRNELYQAVTKRFAQQAFVLWGWYTQSASASVRSVHGLRPPPLPSGEAAVSIAGFQPVVGLWRDR